MTTAVDK